MKKFLSCVLCIFLCGSALAQVDSRLNSNNPPFPDVQILEIQLDNVTLNTAATPSLIYSFPYTGGEVTFAQSAGNTNANTDVPEYLYNGKEKQAFETAATNYLDYGARFYNPVTGRWNTQDPMAEKYYSLSPFSYCSNNPSLFIDPTGEKIIFVNGLETKNSGKAGSDYWKNGKSEAFIKGAQKYFNDYNDNVKYVEETFKPWCNTIWPNTRIRMGYEYAKTHYNELVGDLKEGETIKFVSHSMGAAFAEGMARYLEEMGQSIEMIVHINAYQASSIRSLTDAIVIDYQNINDPVINLFSYPPQKGIPQISGSIQNASVHKRTISNKELRFIHKGPISSGYLFWNELQQITIIKRSDFEDQESFVKEIEKQLKKL